MTITYYIGDNREILKSIPDKSIDMVITSPPYNIGIDYGGYKDNLPQDEYHKFMKDVLKECYRIVVDDGRIAYNIPHVQKECGSVKTFPILDFSKMFIECGFNIREIIFWFKTKNESQTYQNDTSWGSWMSASNPHLRGHVEPIIVANKGSWKKESGSKISDVIEEEFKNWTKSAWFISGESYKSHPAIFPLDIPFRLIKLYTFKNDTILDPFVGSGTTLRACEISGRNGIGIDINPEYKNCLTDKKLVLDKINKNSYIVRKRRSLFEDEKQI